MTLSLKDFIGLSPINLIEFFPHTLVVGASQLDAHTLDLESERYVCFFYYDGKPYCVELKEVHDYLKIQQKALAKEVQWPVVLRITRVNPSQTIKELKDDN